MRLRFIGKDGSMGLKHGEVYDVKIHSFADYIFVERLKYEWTCPYTSIKNFTANWEDV